MNNEPILTPSPERASSACFTGHRFLPPARRDAIAEKTAHVIAVLAEAGYRTFYCGGAMGFDTLAERLVIEERRRRPGIRLVLALPCRDQTGRWQNLPKETARELLREYQEIKGLADGIVYVRDFYTDGCMKERNRYMVERSSFLVACYDGTFKSGAGQTVRMAQKAGLGIYNVLDALGMTEGGVKNV